MHSLYKLICLTLVLNVIEMKIPEFEFRHITLGHSGILITWKPKGNQNEFSQNVCLEFGYRSMVNRNDRKFSFYRGHFYSNYGQCKLYPLEEDTCYEVIVQQCNSRATLPDANYILYMKTNRKTNAKPAKPDFKWRNNNYLISGLLSNLQIKWLPCGMGGNCIGEEAGTHFATKISMPDRRGEYREDEYSNDYQYLSMYAGMMYEVTIISINNELETESDPHEIYIEPKFGAVTYPKVISFPNASILVTWKPPKFSLLELVGYEVSVANDSSLGKWDFIKPSHVLHNSSTVLIEASKASNGKKLLFDAPNYGFKHGVSYSFLIIPIGINGPGFETRIKHTIPIKDDN